MLSDINFTSMVPELSRSADHLCQQKINEEADEDGDYFKGNLLKTPDYTRGITPSASMIASPGVSQWTVNESTTQTEAFWHDRGESFDSSKSYSLRSGHSMNVLNKHQRSRSVPSIRCAVCKQNHHTIKPSESMHYAMRTVTFQGENCFRCYEFTTYGQVLRTMLKSFNHHQNILCFFFSIQNHRKRFVARCQTCDTTAHARVDTTAVVSLFIGCTSRADRPRVY